MGIEQRRTRRKTSLAGSDIAENRLTIATRKLDDHTTTIEPALARDRAVRVQSLATTGIPERVHAAIGERPSRPEHAALWDTAAGAIEQHHATWPTGPPNSRQPTKLVYDQTAQHISQLTRTYQQTINPPAITPNIARNGPSLGISR